MRGIEIGKIDLMMKKEEEQKGVVLNPIVRRVRGVVRHDALSRVIVEQWPTGKCGR